jgi:hypothetical protein
MRIVNKIFLAIIFIFIFSCEDQVLIVKCPDCTADEPLSTDLDVKLEQEYYGFQTVLNVYEGNLEDSVLYRSYKVTGSHASVSVILNKKYTLTATYYIPGNYYIAVDSAEPRVKYDKSQCDSPCYYVYDKTIDLRLKYTAR